MAASPLLLLAVGLGTVLYLQSRKPKPLPATTSATPAGGPDGSGQPNIGADGFMLLPDCAHLQVYDREKFAATLKAFYRANVLGGGSLYTGGQGAADAHARRFFTHYFSAMAPNCLPAASAPEILASENIVGPFESYVLPTNATLAQQIMYGYVFTAMAGLLMADGRWTATAAGPEVNLVIAMLKTAGMTEADWNETFKGTVQMPKELAA